MMGQGRAQEELRQKEGELMNECWVKFQKGGARKKKIPKEYRGFEQKGGERKTGCRLFLLQGKKRAREKYYYGEGQRGSEESFCSQ